MKTHSHNALMGGQEVVGHFPLVAPYVDDAQGGGVVFGA